MPDSFYFASYAREDADLVHRVVEGTPGPGRRGLWLDTMLVPGVNWANAIHEAVENMPRG